MSESVIVQGIRSDEDAEFSELCRGLVSLCHITQISQRIVQHVLPNLTRDELRLLQNDQPITAPILDSGIIRILSGLKESAQMQLEDMLTDFGVPFGFSLDLIRAGNGSLKNKCFFLEIQKFDFNEGPYPGDRPGGDDNVEPHADMEDIQPMLMAMAAGTR